jgi:hypothetical protein
MAHRMAAVEKKRKEGGDVMGTLTLRDYFAAKAMQGLVANNNTNPFEISKAAYVVADAMMEARNAAQ